MASLAKPAKVRGAGTSAGPKMVTARQEPRPTGRARLLPSRDYWECCSWLPVLRRQGLVQKSLGVGVGGITPQGFTEMLQGICVPALPGQLHSEIVARIDKIGLGPDCLGVMRGGVWPARADQGI